MAELFQFINEQHLDVRAIYGYGYEIPAMPADSVAALEGFLISKPYLDNPEVNGERINIQYDTANSVIKVRPRLFDMSDGTYQEDWLQTVSDKGMTDNNSIVKGMSIRVPEGMEQVWADALSRFDVVQWAGEEGSIVLHGNN
jgi:hypothetical protein